MNAVKLTQSLQTNRLSLGVTALNGLMGHTLKDGDSPLAVRMGFYHRNRPLALTQCQFDHIVPKISNKIVVFVHGLASHEQMWAYPNTAEDAQISYGSLLLRDQGFTPLYLRYNSGLRVSENGRLLAALLEELLLLLPDTTKEIVLVGHSLGGLLIRSACHYAEQSGNRWPQLLSKAVYLGTPHHGVPWAALLAGFYQRAAGSNNRFAQTIHTLHENRSPSMRDIISMSLVDEHWQEGSAHPPLPWYPGAKHYFIAGSINQDPNHLLSHAFGDVLVPLDSAQARSEGLAHLPVPPLIEERSIIVPGVKHIALAHNHEVYDQLKLWLGDKAVSGMH